MSSEATIDDLPDEMLEQIVQHLDWYDRQSLTLVSKRFARLTFGMGSNIELHISALRGHSRLELARYGRCPISIKYREEELYQALLSSQRPYKHVVVWIANLDFQQNVREVVDHFHESIDSLKLISGHHRVDLAWVVQILKTCPNLSSLDIKDLSLSDDSIRMAVNPMRKLRTLYARSRILNAITNCSEAFANVISLHTNLNPPKDLMQKLSSQLEELTLTFTVGDQITLPEENFPNLETLKFVWADRCADHLTRKHFQRLLKRTPKLKKLSIEPLSVQFNLLELVMEDHKIIQHLGVPLDYVNGDEDDDEDFEVYEGHPEERPNLKSLCLYDIEFYGLELMAERFKFVNVCQLRLSQCDLAYFEWIKVLPEVFPSLTELDLEDEDPEEPINFVKIARMISENVPSLRRLTLDLRGRNLNLTTFMQFCGSLKVRELSVESDHLEIEGKLKAPLKKALSIRSLAIKTYTIDSNAYVPMMEAMPELRKLELQLSGGCSNETQIELIRAKFPRCDIVRKRFKDTCFDTTR